MISLSERREELVTACEAFPEFCIVDKLSGYVEVPMSFDEPRKIIYVNELDEGIKEANIQHLPPFRVSFGLTDAYPESPPVMDVTSDWLSEGTKMSILEALRILHEDVQMESLCTLVASLFSDAADIILGKTQEIKIPAQLAPKIYAFNAQQKLEIFNLDSYDCEVCFDTLKGPLCYQLENCGHTFCRECLVGYWEPLVKTGDVLKVLCMSDCDAAAWSTLEDQENDLAITRSDLEAVLRPDLVARYIKLVRQRMVDVDPHHTNCYRVGCEGICEVDEDSLAICQDCGYAFCNTCKRLWHGPGTVCDRKTRLKALAARSDPASKEEDGEHSARRTKNKQKAMEQLSQYAIESSTTKCPKCLAQIEKIENTCNRMYCTRCSTFYCNICGEILDHKNPYRHFSTDSSNQSACRGRLWDDFISKLPPENLPPLEDDDEDTHQPAFHETFWKEYADNGFFREGFSMIENGLGRDEIIELFRLWYVRTDPDLLLGPWWRWHYIERREKLKQKCKTLSYSLSESEAREWAELKNGDGKPKASEADMMLRWTLWGEHIRRLGYFRQSPFLTDPRAAGRGRRDEVVRRHR